MPRPKGSKNKPKVVVNENINLEQIEQDRAEAGNTRDQPPSALEVEKNEKKQGLQSGFWCFTYNNYKIEQIERLEQVFRHECKWYIFQEEKGENGTEHLQSTVAFKNRKRFTEIIKYNEKIHWEPTKSVTASIVYCTKEESRFGKIYYWGYEPPVKYKVKIENKYPWQIEIEKLIKQKPDDRSVYWYYGPEGCNGKTTFQKYIYTNYEGAVILSGKGADMKNGVVQYQQKNKKLPKIVMINVPRCVQDYVSYAGIEEVKDMMFFSGKYEGEMVCGECPHVICFANEEPEKEKMSKDRWQIRKIS